MLASIWQAAGAVIDATFADPELIIYTGAGLSQKPLRAIRSDTPAPDFDGVGKTLRTISYEVEQSDFPLEPRKTDTFIHRGRLWRVEDRTRRDEIGKWELIVVDSGPAT